MTQTHFHAIYFRNQFQQMNDSLVHSCSTDIEAFLNDIDRSVAASHDILRHFNSNYVCEMEDKDWLEAQGKVCSIMALLLHLHMQTQTEIPMCFYQRTAHQCL